MPRQKKKASDRDKLMINELLSNGFKHLVNSIPFLHVFRDQIKGQLKNAENDEIKTRLLKAMRIVELYENVLELEAYIERKKAPKKQLDAEGSNENSFSLTDLKGRLNEYADAFMNSQEDSKVLQMKAAGVKIVAQHLFDNMHRDSHALYYVTNILIGISIIGLVPLALKGALTGHGFFYETTRQRKIEKIKRDLDKIEPVNQEIMKSKKDKSPISSDDDDWNINKP